MSICVFFILFCVQHCDCLRYNVTAVALKQHDVLSIQGTCSLSHTDLYYVQASCNYIYVCDLSPVSLTTVSTAAAVGVNSVLPQAI
jgi:hypothetical protein